MVLSVLALRTERLGAGMIAHATFNAVTFITIALGH
jgi:membrane protease YdiL (CAAX protease family)